MSDWVEELILIRSEARAVRTRDAIKEAEDVFGFLKEGAAECECSIEWDEPLSSEAIGILKEKEIKVIAFNGHQMESLF